MDSELERLRRRVDELEQRLLAIENSRLFRLVRWPGRILLDWKGRVGQRLLHSPFHPLYLKLVRPRAAVDQYRRWLQQETTPTGGEFRRRPLISIIMPVHNPRPEWLAAAVESIAVQSYGCWELCVCDDASSGDWVEAYFSKRAATEPRIRFVRSPKNLGISGASNRAGELARGDYVGFLDQDDILCPYALHSVVESLQQGDVDLIYSDEDRFDETGRLEPIFKPGWSPDLLLCCMYLGHFLVAKKTELDRIGWFRGDFDGSQDYDLALRLTDGAAHVHHIPRVLYHWRKHPASTAASSNAKPHTHQAGREALRQAVARRGYEAAVEDGPQPNSYRLRWRVRGEPKASIVICSRKLKLLDRCLRSIERTTSYRNREVVVVWHSASEDIRRGTCTVAYTEGFNFAAMNNMGVERTTGDVLVFLNDDVEPLHPGWLDEIIAHAQRPEVGVVGARLLYPSGSIQHAGLVLGIMQGVGHVHRDTFGSAWWNWLPFTRNVAAVTGACLAIRKTLFQQLGGFDAAFPVNFNDADLCLRARQAGYEVVFEPAALLRHHECQSRMPGVCWEERERWKQRWGEWLRRGDPYYSPHLTKIREDASLHRHQI